MNFAEAMKDESRWTRTENGAVALNTTGNALLDLYSTIGALRNAADVRVESLFAAAYAQDPLFATKILFYARDIREGNVGSRHDVFHADESRRGVQLASGQSVTVFKQILENIGLRPVEAMERVINSERYECISIEEA